MLVTGCASPSTAESAPPTTPDDESATVETPSPSATAQERLVVGIEGVSYERAGDADEFAFVGTGESEEFLTLLADLTGTTPEVEQVDDPYGGDGGTSYTWDELTVMVHGEDEDRMRIAIVAPTVGGVPIVTAEGGLSVGSARSDVVAAGARDDYDADGDGVADYLGLGELEVPGTESLHDPGEVGIQYVLLQLAGDAVTQIQAPADDFSDI